MKKLLLLLTIISHFAFGQNASSKYDAAAKKSYLQTGVAPKANVVEYTDTASGKSPIWTIKTPRIKIPNVNSTASTDTAKFDNILVTKGDSLTKVSKKSFISEYGTNRLKGDILRTGNGESYFGTINGGKLSWVDTYVDDSTRIQESIVLTPSNSFAGTFMSSKHNVATWNASTQGLFGDKNFSFSLDQPYMFQGSLIKGDSVYRTNDSLRYIQLGDADDRYAPIGGGGIDTLKVGRIEQGRGTAPIFMYFNGVAWVRNDTSYVSQTGTNKFSGDFLSNQSFFTFGLNSTNNHIIYSDQNYGRMISENSSSGIQSSVGAFSSSDGSIQLVVTNPTPAYSRQFVINGSNSATPNLAYMFDKGIAYYNGDYSAEMEASQNLIPSLKKVKQLISDSVGTAQSTTLADGKIWIGDGTNTAFPRTLSGDVTVSNLGEATVDSINGITKSYYDPTSSIQTQLNSKQATIGLTTTGAIGAASYSNPTINIPKGYDELPTLGVIKSFTGSDFNITTDWNTASSGGSFTFGSNKLAMSGTIGTTTYTNYVYISTYVSNLDIYSLEENFKNTSTPSATTYGFSLGVVSLNPSFGLTFKIGMTTSDYGRLYMYNTGGSLMAISDNYFSSGALNDEFNIKITCHKTMMTAVLTCTAGTNIGKSIYLSGSGGGLGATYRFAQYQHGGTYDVTSLVYNSDQPIGVEYLFEGNSITKASTPTDINQRYVDFLAKTNKGRFVVHAGSGNSSAEALLTVSEVVTIAPKYVFVFIGTNDAYGAVSTATYAANIASYVSALTSVGYVVGTNIFFISALPRNGVNVVPYNDVLKANYPTAYIDAYYSFEDPAHLTYLNPKYDAGDQVHLNSQGHIDLANIIETAKMSIFTKKDIAEPRKLDLTFTKSSSTLLSMPSQYMSPYGFGVYRGVSNINYFKPIASLANTSFVNNYSEAVATGTSNAYSLVGTTSKASMQATLAYLNVIGAHNEGEMKTTTANPSMIGTYSYTSANAVATTTAAYGMYIGKPQVTGGSLTGTNSYLLYLDDATTSTSTNLLNGNSYGSGTFTNKYSIYSGGGNSLFAGNSKIGIGVAATARLQVKETTSLGTSIGNYNEIMTTETPTSQRMSLHNYAVRTTAGSDYLSAAMRLQINIDGTNNMSYVQWNGTGNGGGLSFGTTTGFGLAPNDVAERMRITSSGFVGIGTTSPTALLTVGGTVIIQSYTVATLPACVAGTYTRATVTDALAPTYDAIVVGGGTRVIEVICNGTNFVCH